MRLLVGVRAAVGVCSVGCLFVARVGANHWFFIPCSRANSPLPPTPWIAARGPPTQQTLLGGCCGGPEWFGQGGGEAQGGCRLLESGADSWGSPGVWLVIYKLILGVLQDDLVGDLLVDPGGFTG